MNPLFISYHVVLDSVSITVRSDGGSWWDSGQVPDFNWNCP